MEGRVKCKPRVRLCPYFCWGSSALTVFLLAGKTEGDTVNALSRSSRYIHLIAETSLNAVSNNYFYQHHQVTVWLWAIFPPSMWQGCNGTSVCIWDIVTVCPRVWSHFMFQPESDLRYFLTHRTDFIWFNWTFVKVKEWKSNTTLALADQYEYLMQCVQEGVMNCSTGASEKSCAKSHLLCKPVPMLPTLERIPAIFHVVSVYPPHLSP